MPLSCSIQSCTNNKKKNESLHFHRFPPDREMCKRWVNACRRRDPIDTTSARICSEHFLPTDYERDLKSELLGLPIGKRGLPLKTDAVPSQKLPTTSCSTSTPTPSASDRANRMELKRKKTKQYEMVEDALCTCASPAVINEEVPEDSPASRDQSSPQKDTSETPELLLTKIELNDLQEKHKKLLFSFNQLQKTNRVLRKKIKNLEKEHKKIEDIEKEQKKLKKATAAFAKEKKRWELENKKKEDVYIGIQKIFTQNQIKLISGAQSRVRWTSDEISQGFTLRFLGQKGYIFLRNQLHFPFPALSTLQAWAQAIELKNGFIEKVLLVMGKVGANLDPFEKMTVLLFDEMKVQELYEFDIRQDEVIGPCKQMQVIMARGLTSNWKQVIYIDFDKKMTKKILTTAVTLLNNIGFKVVACVSDMGGGNISLINELEVTKDKPEFHIEGYEKPIVYFPDAPHLLKLIRNWLIDYGFVLDDMIISIEPIRQLIHLSDKSEVRAAHKLTEEHLPKKGSFSRQNVRKASEVLSKTTARSLEYFEQKNKIKSEHCQSTANFVLLVDKWFDLVNVRYVDRGFFTPPQRKAYGMVKEEQDSILDKMAETMERMKINNTTSTALQIFQKAAIQHTNAMKTLYNNLHTEGLKYLLPNKVNQDALENFFMQERAHCGSNTSPTPLQAKQNARFIFLGKNPGAIVKNKNALNKEDDEEYIVARALAFNRETTTTEQDENNRDLNEQDEQDIDDPDSVANESEELEDDVPVVEDDYGHDHEEENEEEGLADILQKSTLEDENIATLRSSENTDTSPERSEMIKPSQSNVNTMESTNSTQMKTATTKFQEEKYDTTKEEGHEWLCGWIALKYNTTYPHLQVPRERLSTVTDEHPYTEKPPSRTFVEYVSDGGLTIPTEEFLAVGIKLDNIFYRVNGDDFLRGPGLLAKLCAEADESLNTSEKSITPPKVIRRFFKLRICIRVRHKNLHLKQRKMKARLKEAEKLRKIAT